MDVLNNVPIIDRLDEAIDLFFSLVFVIWSATVANYVFTHEVNVHED